MKNVTATICLTIAVLLGSTGVGVALPECDDISVSDEVKMNSWNYEIELKVTKLHTYLQQSTKLNANPTSF